MSHVYQITTSVGEEQENKRIYGQELHRKYDNIVSITLDAFMLRTDDSIESVADFIDSLKKEGDQYYIFQVDDAPMIRYTNGAKQYFIGEVLYGKNFLMNAKKETA